MGSPPAAPIQAFFGPGSGTVGRAPECTLALPDETRHVSRQQARIDVAPGAASITCLSAANALLVNGQELRQGETRRLAHGDRIHVAEYELRFEETAAPATSADVLIPDDPFADPFADPSANRTAPPSGNARADPAAAKALIPEAFEPFAEPAARSSPAGARSGSRLDPLGLGLQADPMADLAAGRADSIDALFDLKPGVDPLGPDSPLGRPFGEKPPPAQAAAAARAGEPVADNASILSGSFRLPQAIPPTAFDSPVDPRPSDAAGDCHPLEPGAPDESVLSWKEPAADGDAIVPPPPGGDSAELLRALLQGLGLAELPRVAGAAGMAPQALTPELMHKLGELLATACDGTVCLLQARATLKQELRADVTMIRSHDNNPLKFVPDGQTALNQLLAAQVMRGFMPPRAAMRDAFDDLLAHQIGFVAGMRAALQGLVGRFDPQVLETRLAPGSMLETMLPGARKARLWELFTGLYSEVSREAEDDFERLFGRAFVKAYEEQIARIEASPQGQVGEGAAAGRGAGKAGVR